MNNKKIMLNIFITTIIIALLIGVLHEVSAQTPIFSESEVAEAIAVQALYENDLMSRPGVQGVGIGEKDGELGILILVDEKGRELELPTEIEYLPVIVRVVGQIKAHQINLGVSGGNDIVCQLCDVGTVGFKVCDNTIPNVGGWISNNHVVVSGCTGTPGEKCPNMAPLGTNQFSPGLVDNTPVCTTTGAANVGTLNRFVTFVLDAGGTNNPVDAGFVQSTDAQVSDNIQGLGVQSNTVAAPFLTQAVCKSGRTTGVTCGTVTGINVTADISYDTCGTARFINQVMYAPTPPDTTMSQSGDSGSPVVNGANDAVALHFAGDGVNGYGNPIGTVLAQLQVSLCGDIPEPPTANANGPYTGECQGTITDVTLDGTGSSDPDPGDVLTYSWSTDCPGGFFDDPTSPTPVLSIDSSTQSVSCNVTLTVTDSTDNSDTDSSTVVIVDTTAPTINCPPDATIECDQSTDPANTGTASATDVCDANPVISFSDMVIPGTCPEESTITRTWTATDASGNASSCEQAIEVVDTTPPDIQCNAPATITPSDAPISFTATATDNCASDPSVEIIGYDCFFLTKKGKEISKELSCIIEVNGDTITIIDSGGIGDNISWTVRASDNCGNIAESTCSVEVVKK